MSIVFRDAKSDGSSDVENSLEEYAISLNNASTAIGKWLTALYCTPTEREKSPCASFDPSFDAFVEYLKIRDLVVEMGNENSDEVAAKIVINIQKATK